MTPSNLQDAEASPWNAERKPDPTPAELRLKLAGLNYAKAAEALHAYTGARDVKRPDYAEILKRHQDTGAELLAAGRALAREAG